jgi:hypothetical protein
MTWWVFAGSTVISAGPLPEAEQLAALSATRPPIIATIRLETVKAKPSPFLLPLR